MSVRVLIVDAKSERSERLETALRTSGFTVVGSVRDHEDMAETVSRMAPDAIIIDSESPTRDTLEHFAALHRHYPRPMVMFAEHGTTAMTRAAAQAGVSAYVVEGLSPAMLRSLIDVSILHFQDHSLLQAELERALHSLDERDLVDRAKRLLMQRRQLSESDAYTWLRRMAMNRSQRMAELAQAVITGVVS